MYKAKNVDGKFISINDAIQGGKYYCPTCKKRLTIKNGEHKAPHFAHFPHETCFDGWKYDSTDWSNKWKEKAPIEQVEKNFTIRKETHHVDWGVSPKLAMMFQNGFISKNVFDDKNNCILGSGEYQNVLWLFNVADLFKNHEITLYINDYSNYCCWKNPSKLFKDYGYNSNILIAFELFDNANPKSKPFIIVEKPELIYSRNIIEIKRLLTREQFEAYYNDIAKGLDPEARFKEEDKAKELALKKREEEEAKQRRIAEEKLKQQREERAKQIQIEEEKRRKEQEEYLRLLAERRKKETEEQEKREEALKIQQEIERESEEKRQKELFSSIDNRLFEPIELVEDIKQNDLVPTAPLIGKATICDIWNNEKPNSYITVTNGDKKYRIESDPNVMARKYNGKIYGVEFGTGENEGSKVVIDADKPIWERLLKF